MLKRFFFFCLRRKRNMDWTIGDGMMAKGVGTRESALDGLELS